MEAGNVYVDDFPEFLARSRYSWSIEASLHYFVCWIFSHEPPEIGTGFFPGRSCRDGLENGLIPFADKEFEAKVILGIVFGMRHLHSEHILYRSLSPETIRSDEQGHIRLESFSASETCFSGSSSGSVQAPAYTAPEQYEEGEYTSAVDVYAFALVLYELLSRHSVCDRGLPPRQIMYQSVCGQMPEIPESVKKPYKSIIVKGWQVSPQDRPTFDEIFNQ
jgi:serine/threonine protein kinase